MAAKLVNINILNCQYQVPILSGCSSLSSCRGGGTVQHGGPPPHLGLHQPHRDHGQQAGGVGGPFASTLCSSSKGGECTVNFNGFSLSVLYSNHVFCSGMLCLQMMDIAQNLRSVVSF